MERGNIQVACPISLHAPYAVSGMRFLASDFSVDAMCGTGGIAQFEIWYHCGTHIRRNFQTSYGRSQNARKGTLSAYAGARYHCLSYQREGTSATTQKDLDDPTPPTPAKPSRAVAARMSEIEGGAEEPRQIRGLSRATLRRVINNSSVLKKLTEREENELMARFPVLVRVSACSLGLLID
eukprot:2036737-Rhodomonas_salina.1